MVPGHEAIGAKNGVPVWAGEENRASFPCSLCVFLASGRYWSLQDIVVFTTH